MNINSLVENYKTVVLERYAKFDGRAGRREFWYFVLANLIISFIVSLLRTSELSTIYSLAVFVPSLAVGVRRLHDINKSGWYLLIGLIPIVGQIVLIIWAAQAGMPGSNQYGNNPEPGSGAPSGNESAPAPQAPEPTAPETPNFTTPEAPSTDQSHE